MVYYYTPGVLLLWAYHRSPNTLIAVAAAACLIAATVAIPGYMTHYCRHFDPAEIFNPFVALRRSLEGGARYWHAWGIALLALSISSFGLLLFGVGFLVTSVWFWQVAGYAFANVFTHQFLLSPSDDASRSSVVAPQADPRHPCRVRGNDT
jgi:hypothetical protein